MVYMSLEKKAFRHRLFYTNALTRKGITCQEMVRGLGAHPAAGTKTPGAIITNRDVQAATGAAVTSWTRCFAKRRIVLTKCSAAAGVAAGAANPAMENEPV